MDCKGMIRTSSKGALLAGRALGSPPIGPPCVVSRSSGCDNRARRNSLAISLGSATVLWLVTGGVEAVDSDVVDLFTAGSVVTCAGSVLTTPATFVRFPAMKECFKVGNGGLVLTNAGK